MINGAELLEAITEIASERNISKEVIFEGIVEGFKKAFERFYDTEAKVIVDIDETVGTIKMFQELTVVNDVEDDWLEITLEDAKNEFGKSTNLGDVVRREIKFNNNEETIHFSRMAVEQVRQIIKQKIRGAERENVYSKFIDKKGEVVLGKIIGMNDQGTSYIVDIEGTHESVWIKKIIYGEVFEVNQFVEFYLEDVSKDSKFSQLSLTRIAPEFLGKLLEEVVPEIKDGIVEIKAISREPGNRAKVAVITNDENIDPVGAVVGTNGTRINQVTKQLNGEKIDVIKFSENMSEFVINAMAPVKVISISVDEENRECDVIVPNEQLSLAIGKKGMAARLVANLVSGRINIFSYSNAQTDGLDILWNGNITEEELNDPKFLENVNKRREKTARPAFVRKPREIEIDFAALEEFQNEIRAEQENMDKEAIELVESFADIVKDEPLVEETKETVIVEEVPNIDEINANLEAFNSLDDEEEQEDEEDLEEYDEYYEM